RLDYPKGLIKYSSGRGMADRLSVPQMLRRSWRPRVWFYGALFLLMASLLIGGLGTRKGFAVDIIRDRGTMAREVGNGDIENLYRLKVMNTSEQQRTYTVKASGLSGLELRTPPQLSVTSAGIGALTVRLALPAQAAQELRGKSSPITFEITSDDPDDSRVVIEKSTFLVPR
ncbi:MAG: FixG Ig-like domain-containing protein, partial [Rhodoferax sp.]|nr:FixG Ig-like domain-containing protein [Rhodoferax sp.]